MWYRMAVAIRSALSLFDKKVSECEDYTLYVSTLPWFIENPFNKLLDWLHQHDQQSTS